MATYNASKFLANAIESILNQTFQELELIIADDGSTDNTLDIIKNYAERDSRIRIIELEHEGVSIARNRAVEVAQYSWIAVMDADDIALPYRLEKQIAAAVAQPDVVAWGAAVHHINSKGHILSVSRLGPPTKDAFYQQLQNGYVVGLNHPTALLKKEVFDQVGGYSCQFQVAQDLEMFDRMADHGPILALPEPLVLYRVHLHSASMQKFFLQRQNMRYVRARRLARQANLPEPTLDEFLEECRRRPPLARISKYLETLGMFYYRKAGLCFGEGHYIAGSFFLGVSVALNSSYSAPRLWRQVFATETRGFIQKTSHVLSE
jgi:glycosyltransferase involved in cell wall biosynthesis